MSSSDKKQKSLKEKIFHEMVEYGINFVYLTLVFEAISWYRRLVLAAYDLSYAAYGISVIEALVLAKVIMIGAVFRIGRGLEQKPLILPTLYKTVVFTLFIALFKVLENVIKALWRGTGLTGGLEAFLGKDPREFLAYAIILFVAFIPFFAFKELGRVFGVEKIRALFFRRRDYDGSEQKENEA
jgi:hypothetical protein